MTWLRPERSASRARAQESVRDGQVTGRPWCSISAVRSVPERFNVAEFFVDRHVAEGRGGRRAFRAGGRVVTYGEVADHVARAAGALGAAGLDSEQRALLALNDSPAFAAAFWGAAKLGAVSVPVNTLLAAAEYEFLLNDSRARVAVVEAEVAPRVLAVRERCPWLRAVLVVGGRAVGARDFDEALAEAKPVAEAAPTSPEDVVYWGYTSGSTGAPKAAVHAHQDFLAAADLVGVGVFGIGPDDLIFSASKLSFAFGLGNALYFPARVGAAAVLVAERTTAERAFEVIAAERPTIFFAVPTLYARMLEVPDAERRFDLSSLRYGVASGEALPPAIFDAWADRFGLELVEVVGSTEALHDFIANRPGQARRGAAGRVIAGFDTRLVDDAGAPVPTGTPGHLLVAGPTMAPHYWNRREHTRRTMLGEWLRTGDVFRQDAEGWFYFEGRSDDMLKVSGQWVSPAEVEAHLAAHAAVLEVGVVADIDVRGLTTPRACVVLKAGVTGSPALAAELRAFVRERAAGYKVPGRVEFVADLPRTATGKLQRFRLRRA
ncbi:MAG: benzoate-CoA ligase family protein [Candidatus Rokuibacteriota bacterium]|jgi:benzoate-CoA ligase family protein|nr:MAG: benzoate-CoA ligase family protein [Candidatus Rokubacteria bacterium]